MRVSAFLEYSNAKTYLLCLPAPESDLIYAFRYGVLVCLNDGFDSDAPAEGHAKRRDCSVCYLVFCLGRKHERNQRGKSLGLIILLQISISASANEEWVCCVHLWVNLSKLRFVATHGIDRRNSFLPHFLYEIVRFFPIFRGGVGVI